MKSKIHMIMYVGLKATSASGMLTLGISAMDAMHQNNDTATRIAVFLFMASAASFFSADMLREQK